MLFQLNVNKAIEHPHSAQQLTDKERRGRGNLTHAALFLPGESAGRGFPQKLMTTKFMHQGRVLRHPLIATTTIFMDPVLTALFVGTANRVLAKHQSDLYQIEGRRIVVEVSDLGKSFRLTIRRGRIALALAGPVDLRIAGTAKDFCRLALRLEDPDTLFFARRLILEGETSIGLHLKNILDSIDFDWLTPINGLPAPFGPRIRQTIDRTIRRTHADRRLHDLLDRALQP